MPRPKKPGAPEPKKRSRNGCWPCKNRKVKCDEGHPQCDNCQKAGIECDFSVRLNWLGDGNYRPTKKRRPDQVDATQRSLSTTSSPPCDGKTESRSETLFNDSELPPLRGTFNTEPQLRAPTPTAPSSLMLAPINEQGPVFSPESASNIDQAPLAGTPDALSNQPPQHSPETRPPNDSDSRDGHTSKPGYDRLSITSIDETPSYMMNSSVDSSSSAQNSPVRLQNGPKPPKTDGVTDVLPWSPGSASTAGSPGMHPGLQWNFSLPSAPSPLTSVSTPGAEDEHRSLSRVTPYLPPPSDIRRLSVQSLLSSPNDPSGFNERPFSRPSRASLFGLSRVSTPDSATFYGYDTGKPDRDIGQNDDAKAILGYSQLDSQGEQLLSFAEIGRESHPSDFGFGMRDTGNYYEKRVEIWISKELEPLPPKLRQSPMNLVYFHHFLNHTARVLVPHDDPQSNPFRTVLPQMAVRHDNLLSLLLAYSASHRARHLKYPEPSLRIAHLVQGVIADLRSLVQQSMSDPATVISTADVAAAIMLASLEIISPAAIGGSIPWHHHLNIARELVSRMPDGLRCIQTTTQEDCIRSFLWSWFAYLDVLGSLSGGPATLLTPSCYTTGGPPTPIISNARVDGADAWDEDMERIDCILGFTPRCVFILARIAQLARQCEEARLLLPSSSSWTPDAATESAAAALETAALRSLAAPSRPCGHVHGASPLRRWDRTQMAAANRAFHHAALIHLHRRVLGKTSAHPDVRGAAQSVLECLEHVERGSSAELCLLFPMFTAGCELVDPGERRAILARVVSVERTGMMQVQRARKLMEKVWETGQPWETLVDTEFIG